ncbi:uncharacterized protein Z519_08654 [Cladophialophora bantiana CBS 173.52]|uniref:Uncharacterized protein n=1 Tax=Cladophialophora bantiana (strain ATCC 10958 / CBS 173.52 / CDC B-1940 / NIH 8579) TaxID=1442370 RepID=A0A0D2ELI9_CLAB1|nr:uncharacterized protein Z519_08654 [Cladophialophora bantiana CBS 173.52]KIW90871.1 hypothetical protein Z519_08654 [Cladophialophora bantiana CBS 173.52]
MPSAGTLALSTFLNSASGPSSRKRSHAEITRSLSRSITPDQVPSKRRRITHHPTPESSRDSTPQYPESRVRFQGDGFDYRRPAMSARVSRATATPTPQDVTIDLTADTDSDDTSIASESSLLPQPSRHASIQPSRQTSTQPSGQVSSQPPARVSRHHLIRTWIAAAQRREAARRQLEAVQRQQEEARHVRAPPFGGRPQDELPEIIDLSDTDDSDFEMDEFEMSVDTETLESESVGSPPASSEVEFVSERTVPQPQRQEAAVQANVGANAPRMDRGTFGYFPEILRRGTQFMFGNMQNIAAPGYNEGFLDRLDGVPPRGQDARQGNDVEGAFIVNMDYRQPAFALGRFDVFDRSSETPQVVPEPYKAPPAAHEGFIRTFGEEDVILCPMCGDELAVGKGDVKKQVWVVKACGHVYCGECAVNRSKTRATRKGKGKAKEQEPEKKLESPRSVPFTICNVDGCNTKVVSKTAMFPIYL